MVNRPAAHAESQDLSRGLEVKVTRRPWNPALHPRDSKGRFIETGGTVRLWSGKLARVVRALPHDRILVQDQSGPNEFSGPRHTTSAKWVTVVARPDGSAPTEDENKVIAEDERRHKDPNRGNGVAKDDDGDPTTPNEPHSNDDQGRPIGDDKGDGPDAGDDQPEPTDGNHPVNLDALPNRPNARGARYADTAAVRRHFLQLAEADSTSPEMGTFLRHLAHDDALQLTPSGRYAILRDDTTGRWYLTATGTGQRVNAAGDFGSVEEAGRFAVHLDNTARSGRVSRGFNEPFDFSDPNLDREARDWRSTKGENIQAAIGRARQEFDATTGEAPEARQEPAPTPDTPSEGRQGVSPTPAPDASGQRFTTLQGVRAHWRDRLDEARRQAPNDVRAERVARLLEDLINDDRLKLVGRGQFAVKQDHNGEWSLIATGSGASLKRRFSSQRDAQSFARYLVDNPLLGDDGKPLDLSDPNTRTRVWRSKDNESFADAIDVVALRWERQNGSGDGAGSSDTDRPAQAPESAQPAPDAPAQQDAAPAPAAALPDGAKPVDGVDGYNYVDHSGIAVTLYGPDGQVVATSERGYPPKVTINGVTIPIPQYVKVGAEVMARAHRAATQPDQRDRITAEWVTFKGKRVMVFRGTVKGDDRDYAAVGSVRAIKWAPSLNGYVTQSNMRPETRDERIAEVLGNLARQDRNVLVSDEAASPSGPAGPSRADAPQASVDPDEEFRNQLRNANDDWLKSMESQRWSQQSRIRSESGRRKLQRELRMIDEEKKRRQQERDDAVRQDPTALSDADIEARIRQSQDERGMYGSRRGEAANDVEQAVYGERRRRSQAIADDTTDLTSMSEEDLRQAQRQADDRSRLHQAAGDDADAEKTVRDALQARSNAILGEQERRRADSVASSKPVADLTDDELESEYRELLIRPGRRSGNDEAQRVLDGRMNDIKEEQKRRQVADFVNRPDPADQDSADLTREYEELAKGRTSYETDTIATARKERMDAIAAELDRRDAEANQALLDRAAVDDDTVSVDGGTPYATIGFNAHGGAAQEAGWYFRKYGHYHGSSGGGFPSRSAAIAAAVRAYGQDDSRRGERTWGRERRVFVPKMFAELYQSARLGDRLESASPERQYLYDLFKARYGWDDGVNPLVPSGKKGYHIKGRNLSIPEGLLAEFHRITEELSRDMAVKAADRDADGSDRQKAKNRLGSINAALHGIEAAREAVRNNGGNDDQKVISREEIEAQQAALRAALGGNDDGEHVRADGAGALADVPAAGVGGDEGSARLRGNEGQGDRGADSGGRGGAGEDGAGAGGVRGGSGPASADQGGRDGDGAAGAPAGAGGGDHAGADAGDGGTAGDEGRGLRPVARFRPNPEDVPKRPIQRAAGNLDAIRALKAIEREKRPPTERELRALSRFTGWGSVPILFANEPNEKEPRYQQGGSREGKFAQDHRRWAEYRDLRDALSRELSPLEWRQASRGTLSMHYTPQPVAEAMWDGLRAFGFDRGDVLEAGSGGGTFFGVAPDGARLTGVELDPWSARIAQAMYPDANVLNESFAETDAHPGTFDAAIGNVPFAQIPFDDKRYPAESLHNGFITKELALTRPGGVTILITSRHTLDSKGDKARRQMAKYGDLLGAVRLPSGVFNDAGTGVTTDVLVFRRREDGTEPMDTAWLNAPERDVNGTPHHVNTYFDEHPEHILGTLTTESSPYGPQVTVKGDADKAAEQLRAALEGIAAKATADGRGYEPHPDGDNRPPVRLQRAREKHANDWSGRLYEGDDGKFYQHVNGADPVLIEPSDGSIAQLRDLMQLRDVAAELRELDRKNDEDERAETLRAQLRDLHAAYVAQYGPLSKPGQNRTKGGVPTAWGYFRADPDAGAVLALERWDAKSGEPVLSRIFTERARARRQPLSSTDDPKAALAAVVAATGEVDLGAISRLLDLDPQETLKRLGTEVFTNPATGRLELASAYLSGAVRDKLDAARKAAETDPAFAVNVASLEAVQPPDRTIGQFTPEMGAHWTPPELLQGFLREYLGDRTLHVAHDDRYGWILNTGRVPEANNVLYGVPADPDKGTKGKSAVDIARAVLGFGSLTVYNDDKRKDVDEATSRAVRQKADQMRAEFAKYATANTDRLTTLTETYNRVMNGHVVRSYEGMSPTLEGFTPDRDPHAWQLSGAARMQFERGVILAHEVGLGKTSTLVMGTQALKASGQIEKPMAVVPNHLAKQWADEARYLYPNADIQLITSQDLANGRRAGTLEWLRANKPDLVIFTEEAFGSIKMSPEAQEEYEFRELEALREQLERQYEDATNPSHPFIVAKIEQRIATVQRNINKNAAPMRKPGEVYWDDLGFDYFVVDEAHRYKGVGFRSKEGGGDPASIRGVDLHQKTTDLHRRRGGRATITLATGTPLSNSISEQFTMLSFAAPWVLDAYKAGAPDLWANTFGRKTLRIENAPDGSGLRVVERFSEFHNKRAMKTMWGLVADTKRADDVGIPRPNLAGNKPNLIMVDATPDQQRRLKGLVARGRAIHNGEVDRSQDNMLAVSNEGTSVALDPRLIDPNAPAGNKLKAVADRHIARYHANKDRIYPVSYDSLVDHPVPGSLQMIFLNEGVPGGNNKGGFDAYAELKRLMVAGGIPEDKIAFVQDAKKSGKPEDMTELFRRAREGEIAVMIGSSAVAGTGMNAQDRMISLTHVDLDWGAAQMEQRNGRILRYGNMNPEVEIDIFATKGSMDGWKAGFVAAKAEGLIDIQRPEPEDGDTSDTVQEITGAEFDYETMEAEIGGNPYMSQLMKARRRLKDLEIDQHNEAAERIRRAEALDALKQESQDTREGITRREQTLPRIRDVRGDNFTMTIGGSPYGERSDAGAALHREVTSRLLEHDREGMSPWHIIGQFGGLDFGVRTERQADGKLVAHVGFPDLRHSDFERSVDDLKKRGAGAGMLTRLSNALDKAPALQDSDRAKIPELDEQIALLQSAHAAADLNPQIDHARKRSHLLEEIVARITALDAKPEIDPDELDKKLHKKKADREEMAKERREERVPLQEAVDRAVFELQQWSSDNPEPEQQEPVLLNEEEVRSTLDSIRPEGDATPDAGAADIPEPERTDTGTAGTTRLSEEEVRNTLASIRPEGDTAPDTNRPAPLPRAEAISSGDKVAPMRASDLRPGDHVMLPKGQGEAPIAYTVVRTRPVDNPSGTQVEVLAPKRSRYATQDTLVFQFDDAHGRAAMTDTAQGRKVDAGQIEPPAAEPFDPNMAPLPDMAASTASQVGYGQTVAFEDPNWPGRWIHGYAYFPTIEDDGRIDIAVRGADGGLRSYMVPADEHVWVKGKARKGYERPTRRSSASLTDDGGDGTDEPVTPADTNAPDTTPDDTAPQTADAGDGGSDEPPADTPNAGDLGDDNNDSTGDQPTPDASNAGPAGEPDAYDPSYQQQTDENGRITHYRTPEGVSRNIGGRFGVGEPVRDQLGQSWIVIGENPDGTVSVRRDGLHDNDPLGTAESFQPNELTTLDGGRPWKPSQARAAAAETTPQGDITPDASTPDTVTLTPDEVSAQLDPVRPEGSKSPSSMTDEEISDEMVALMEREMANGELSGIDRTRMQVLEAEEARRAGRAPKREEPKPKQATEEPGGLFDVTEPTTRQADATVDPNNPDDRPDDLFGTPDMFAQAEGRDTSGLRPVRMRNAADLEPGDRYTDADGNTHTVAEKPIRTGRGRTRLVTDDGAERFYNSDAEVRLRYPDEEIPDNSNDSTADTAGDSSTPDTAAPRSEGDTSPGADETNADGQDGTTRPDNGDNTDGVVAAPAWADDLGDGTWLDKPRSGSTTWTRNIYVDAQVQALLGQDQEAGGYYWVRPWPDNSRSEGRFDTPEDAARDFARQLREQDLPRLNTPRYDPTATPPRADLDSVQAAAQRFGDRWGQRVAEARQVLAGGDANAARAQFQAIAFSAWWQASTDEGYGRHQRAADLRAFAIDAQNAGMELVPLRDGERLRTNRSLKPGDVFGHSEITDVMTDGEEETSLTWRDLISGMVSHGPSVPADFMIVTRDPNSPSLRQEIEDGKRALAERQAARDAEGDQPSAPRSRSDIVRARAAARQQELADQAQGDLVSPSELHSGDRVTVMGNDNRGAERTRTGVLLAEPQQVTATRNGESFDAWRLYIGEEGDQPNLRNLTTVLLDDLVDRHRDDRDSSHVDTSDNQRVDGASRDGQSDSNSPDATRGEDTPQNQDDNQGDNQNSNQGEGGAAAPDGAPDAGAGSPDSTPDNGGDSNRPDSNPDNADDSQNQQDEENRDDRNNRNQRRRRRNGSGGGGGAGGAGGGGLGGPGLPHLHLPDFNGPNGTGGSDRNGRDGGNGGRPGGRDSSGARPSNVDDLRQAWRNGDGLTEAENTPERRAALAEAADREGLQLSRGGGLVTWPEPQDDGTTLWRYAQARNGVNLPGLTLTTDNPEEARALADRFEQITGSDGQPFDWRQAWGPSAVAQWRDGQGRNLQRALHAARDDFQQERTAGVQPDVQPDAQPDVQPEPQAPQTQALPDDLTSMGDDELAAAWGQGLSPDDQARVMAEMDRRDVTDQRVRDAMSDTPPATPDEAEREGQAVDDALGFNGTDPTRPTPATPKKLRQEFDALDEQRFQAAMDATGGRFFKPEHENAGVDPRELFSGRKVSGARAKELQSEELEKWFKENDGRLTFSTYASRERDRVLRAEFADIDEARITAAMAYTNGQFFKPKYRYGSGVSDHEVFSGGNLAGFDRWREYASEELQNWFDENGGRLTFNQFKQQRRSDARVDRLDEEERANSGDTTPFTVADVIPPPAYNANAPESESDAAFRFGGADQMHAYAGRAETRPDGPDGSMSVWLDGRRIGSLSSRNTGSAPVWDAHPLVGLDDQASSSQSRDTALANLVTRALQDGPADDANPSQDLWDSVTVHLGGTSRPLPQLPDHLADGTEARDRYDRLAALVDAFRNQESPSGNLRDDLTQARDEFAWLRSALEDQNGDNQHGEDIADLNNRSAWAGRLLDGLGPDTRQQDEQGQQDDRAKTPQPQPDTAPAAAPRAPQPTPEPSPSTPEPTPTTAPEPLPQGTPEPVGGQPAQWARVSDLQPGDMVRMDGRTRRGRALTRAGYVYTGPVQVEVTRNGRTEYMWRTYVTANADGTGASGNVFTPLNATAARAETPDDTVPGSPVSGAQTALRSGGLPDTVPADRNGRGLFPGSTVQGVNGLRTREGTVTGATNTTVSVHWSDGNEEDGLTPSTLTVTGGDRPDGWTPSGQQVRAGHIVADTDGGMLGHVDEVDGDKVTITTAEGTVTRSAGDLRVAGEVRDDTPDTEPVTGVDDAQAGDLKDGDVVVLDLDGTPTTVAVVGTSRDGDRVTIDYADTSTGEMGQIDVDASTVLPRTQGPDGNAPDLTPDDAPEPADDLTVHEPPHRVDPLTGPTVDPDLTTDDRDTIGDTADGPDDDPDAQQAAVRITQDLPVTPEQAAALAAQLRDGADPSTPEGRAALRAANHLDRAIGRTPPAGLGRPRPSNASQIGEGDTVAIPDSRGNKVQVYRVAGVEDGPGGIRILLLEDENGRTKRRVVHGAMPLWQLDEAQPDAVTPPDNPDGALVPAAPEPPAATPGTPDSTPDTSSAPVARVRPGSLRVGDVIDAPTSRSGYRFNGHRRLTIISAPQRNGWWMQLTGVDEDGNVHDFGLHSGREVNVYDRNRPTPALPPAGGPRDPNPAPMSDADRIVADHPRAVAARIIDEAIRGTEPPGDIHALREAIAARLTAEALRDARQEARRDANAALDGARVTGRDRAEALQRLKQARQDAHDATVRAALRTINDLEPLPDETDEELAARARDLLSLIPDQIGNPPARPDADGDPDVTRAVTGHADDAVNALLQRLQAAGVDPGDAQQIARALAGQMAGSRQATARRIAQRVAANNPQAGRDPGLLTRIVAFLIRLAKRFAALVRAGAQKISEKWQDTKERMARLRAFLGRMVRRVRDWPESRRLARLHRAVNLPTPDGEGLAARISHWAGLMSAPGRFGQTQRRVTWWKPTTWAQLAAGRLPGRTDRIQWTPDRAADGGPGLTALRQMAALRRAGSDVDEDVTRRLAAALGDDFGEDPHAALQSADDYVATTERRLVNLQAARSSSTIPDDPDLEVEITAARAELASARSEYGDMRARYAAAVPDAVAAALAELRDMGPEGNAGVVFGPDTNPDAERAVRGVQRVIPRSWLGTSAARRLTAVDGDEGGYDAQGRRLTVADLADDGLGTAAHGLVQHLAQHLDDLDAAQRVYWFTQTHTGRPGARRMRRSALSRILRRQQTQPETGDTLARSIQSMFNGDWYLDDDLRAFLLGLLATR
ncbi:hypothetical protein [Streptomyces sp. NPDC001635]